MQEASELLSEASCLSLFKMSFIFAYEPHISQPSGLSSEQESWSLTSATVISTGTVTAAAGVATAATLGMLTVSLLTVNLMASAADLVRM